MTQSRAGRTIKSNVHLPQQSRLVAIQSIHGVDIPNAWLDVRKSVDVNTACPTVLIVGSAIKTKTTESETDQFDFCREIGEILARNKVNLLSDACPGVPDRIVSAFVQQPDRETSIDLSILQLPWDINTDRAYSPSGFPVNGDIVLYTGSHFEFLSLLNTYCADVVVIVGGGLGSLLEGIVSVVNDLPVICIAQETTVSSEMENLFRRFLSIEKTLSIETCATLTEFESSIVEFAAQFRAESRTSRLHEFLMNLPGQAETVEACRIRVEPSLESITYQCGDQRAIVESPSLVIDPVRILHAFENRPELMEMLYYGPREYHVSEVCIRVDASDVNRIWCPSIDSFQMLAHLRNEITSPVANALDIGTGSGILALWLLKCGLATRVSGHDPNQAAIRCASMNAALNDVSSECEFRAVNYSEQLALQDTFELAVCNPPYVPSLSSDALDSERHFEGLELIINVLETYEQILTDNGQLFMALSSVTWTDTDFENTINELIERRQAIRVASMKLPFKLGRVSGNTKWMDELLQHGGLVRNPDPGYQFLHTAEIWCFTPRK